MWSVGGPHGLCAPPQAESIHLLDAEPECRRLAEERLCDGITRVPADERSDLESDAALLHVDG